MTVVEKRVLQYWSRHDRKYVERGVITDRRHDDWVRDRSLEINIERD